MKQTRNPADPFHATVTASTRILFVQPNLNPPGGGIAVAAWMLEAVSPDHDVTILTCLPVDLENLDRFYGTSLKQKNLTFRVMRADVRRLLDAFPNDPYNFLRMCALMRWCKLIHHEFDIMMSAHDEMDFGVRGIQYVHYPCRIENWARELHFDQQGRWYSGLSKFIETRLRTWRLISGFSFERMRNNTTIVNSRWSKSLFDKTYCMDSRIVYPPVLEDFPDVSWRDKENGFVCIGRLVNQKCIAEVVEILKQVRSEFPDVHLHLIGSREAHDEDYYRQVKSLVARNASWVSLAEDVSRRELTDMVSRHRYGIHGMEHEHFGIAVAEMVQAGCITFVPDGGGQTEIVGNESALTYRTRSEAVEIILRVLRSEQEQRKLLGYLEDRKRLFSVQRFMDEIRDTVREHVKSTNHARPVS